MDKIQVIKCKCGNIFSACSEPHCYTDNDWLKDLKKEVKAGCTVEMVNSGKGEWKFENCTVKNH